MKYIYDTLPICIGEYCLELLTTGIALEFIYGKHLREMVTPVIHKVKIAQGGGYRDVAFPRYICSGHGGSEAVDDGRHHAARHAVIARQEAAVLIEAFAAAFADVASFS